MRHKSRIKSRRPRGRHFWCGKCDADLVNAGSRCRSCGYRQDKYRDKHSRKPDPALEDPDA